MECRHHGSPGILHRIFLGCVFLELGFFSPLVPGASAQTYIFGQANLAAGARPVALVAGDFKGNGKLEPPTLTATAGWIWQWPP